MSDSRPAISLSRPRRIATALAYMSFIILAEALGEKPGAMPHLLMWLPNVLFLGIGAWMFRKLSRK